MAKRWSACNSSARDSSGCSALNPCIEISFTPFTDENLQAIVRFRGGVILRLSDEDSRRTSTETLAPRLCRGPAGRKQRAPRENKVSWVARNIVTTRLREDAHQAIGGKHRGVGCRVPWPRVS